MYDPVPFVAAVTLPVCELVLYVFVIVWFPNVNSFAFQPAYKVVFDVLSQFLELAPATV